MDRSVVALILLLSILVGSGLIISRRPLVGPNPEGLANLIAEELSRTYGYKELYIAEPAVVELRQGEVRVLIGGKMGEARLSTYRLPIPSRASGPILALYGNLTHVWLGSPMPPTTPQGSANYPRARIIGVFYPPVVRPSETFHVKVIVMNVGGMAGRIFCRLAGQLRTAYLSPLTSRSFTFILKASEPGSIEYVVEAGWVNVDDARRLTVLVVGIRFEEAEWPHVTLSADKRHAEVYAPCSGGKEGGWHYVKCSTSNVALKIIRARPENVRLVDTSLNGEECVHAYAEFKPWNWVNFISKLVVYLKEPAERVSKVEARILIHNMDWRYAHEAVGYLKEGEVIVSSWKRVGFNDRWVVISSNLPPDGEVQPAVVVTRLPLFSQVFPVDVAVDYIRYYTKPSPGTVNISNLLYVENPSDVSLQIRIKLAGGSGLRDMEVKLGGVTQVSIEGGRVIKPAGAGVPIPAKGRALISLSGSDDGKEGYSYTLSVEAAIAGIKVDEISLALKG